MYQYLDSNLISKGISQRLNVLTSDNEIQVRDINGDKVIISGVDPSDVTITQISNKQNTQIINDPLNSDIEIIEIKSMPNILQNAPQTNIGDKSCNKSCNTSCDANNTLSIRSTCTSLYFWIFLWATIITIIISVFASHNGFLNWFDGTKQCGLIFHKWIGFLFFILTQFISSYVAYRAFVLCPERSRGISIIFYVAQAIFSILWVSVFFGSRNFKGASVFALLYLITIVVWMIYLWKVDTPSVTLLLINLLWGLYIFLATVKLAQLNR